MRRLYLPAFLIATAPTVACASAREQVSVLCDGGRTFLAEIGEDGALVTIGEIKIEMKPRTSSLGRRFEAAGAALIIDGDIAALALKNDIDFRNCRLANPSS